MGTTAIWWIRRDLRLADNPALHKALTGGGQVVPLFVFDPALLESEWVAPQRVAFLVEGLRLLDADLRARGSRLVLRTGRPDAVLPEVVAEVGATAVYAQEDFSMYARQRDQAVAQVAPLHLLPGLTVHPPGLVKKADGTPYTVFTPFSRTWKQHTPPRQADLLPAPAQIATPEGLPSDAFPETEPFDKPFPPGEVEAQRRLAVFVNGLAAPIFDYRTNRNQLDLAGTAQLSPYLRFGMISARQAVVAALTAVAAAPNREAKKGAETWLNELIWREFYIAILHHFPFVQQRSFRDQYQTIPWRNDPDEFAAWCAGRTGYPVVDAAMRQLLMTGWMHNRARMITASFLVKDLLIDWRWGEKWFMQHLVDGDPAANNGGWQWTAGTGTDAAPYFRIFNPTTQGQKFDPSGHYIRRWLPELAFVPDRYIHEPHKMVTAVQNKANCRIGQDYPVPIVDHREARQRTLAAYKVTAGT
jgi:deoxyribodipyrimidine photo-lyase